MSERVGVGADWGSSIPETGRELQRRVGEYVPRMVDVVVEAVGR